MGKKQEEEVFKEGKEAETCWKTVFGHLQKNKKRMAREHLLPQETV